MVWEDRWIPKPYEFKVTTPNLFCGNPLIVGDLINERTTTWKKDVLKKFLTLGIVRTFSKFQLLQLFLMIHYYGIVPRMGQLWLNLHIMLACTNYRLKEKAMQNLPMGQVRYGKSCGGWFSLQGPNDHMAITEWNFHNMP